jgi:hypothetical protein
MEINIFIFILLIHFLGDFVLQTHEQAKEKHKSPEMLTYHVLTYSFIWLIAMYVWTDNIWYSVYFTCITFVTHWIIDLFSSNIGKPFWRDKDYHNGFVVVGADQVLHYLQLIFTYKLLFL